MQDITKDQPAAPEIVDRSTFQVEADIRVRASASALGRPLPTLHPVFAVGLRDRYFSSPPTPISISLVGLRSPAMAARMILRATISTIGSLRSFKPSLFRAAENASPIPFTSSGPNQPSAPRY